ncbi:hypothetical protein V8G54_012408 [Vigna mungo]|uniref:WRKY domain-containing protein n=1 Tax=Vigna mungo TaxID=3915 RepID=A0AAQ3NU62_VIGMU
MEILVKQPRVHLQLVMKPQLTGTNTFLSSIHRVYPKQQRDKVFEDGDGDSADGDRTKTDVDVLDDGYKWRKYGHKVVKNSLHPSNNLGLLPLQKPKDFVKRLLKKHYRKRMIVVQALSHPWLRDNSRPLSLNRYKLVKAYLLATPLKRAAVKVEDMLKRSFAEFTSCYHC